jgi:ABC-type glycerol-3-phosphate transport system permease component
MDKKRLLATIVLSLPALLHFAPVFYLVCLSFKVGPEIIQYPPKFLPETLNLQNYHEALEMAPLSRFLLNSVIVSSWMTVMQLVTSILAAYALARIEFPKKEWILGFILATMFVPGEVTIIPNYFTLARWEWLNTYRGLVAPYAASGFGVFLLYQFFRTVPKELEEAALIDGCSRMRFLFQILVPLSMPAILAFALYAFVNSWNQYLWPLVVTQSTEMQTAQIGIGMFRSQNESMSWGVIMAATTMLVAPTLLLFVATQRHFVRGITMSGMK